MGSPPLVGSDSFFRREFVHFAKAYFGACFFCALFHCARKVERRTGGTVVNDRNLHCHLSTLAITCVLEHFRCQAELLISPIEGHSTQARSAPGNIGDEISASAKMFTGTATARNPRQAGSMDLVRFEGVIIDSKGPDLRFKCGGGDSESGGGTEFARNPAPALGQSLFDDLRFFDNRQPPEPLG